MTRKVTYNHTAFANVTSKNLTMQINESVIRGKDISFINVNCTTQAQLYCFSVDKFELGGPDKIYVLNERDGVRYAVTALRKYLEPFVEGNRKISDLFPEEEPGFFANIWSSMQSLWSGFLVVMKIGMMLLMLLAICCIIAKIYKFASCIKKNIPKWFDDNTSANQTRPLPPRPAMRRSISSPSHRPAEHIYESVP